MSPKPKTSPVPPRLQTQIRADILAATGLTASAGVARNKFLAKIASDWNKPNGLFVIKPLTGTSFIQDLPVSKIHGVKVTQHKLHQLICTPWVNCNKLRKAY